MCAIGRDLDTSVGANSPATAMLGTGAIGTTPARRPTLLTGAATGRTGTGAGGTILAPTTGRPSIGGGGGGGLKPVNVQR